MWRPWDGRGLEHLRLRVGEGGVEADGVVSTTPFTNTLPIRRLDLGQEESSGIAVVYVDVPNLRLDTSRQRYTCLERSAGGGLYKYEDEGSFRGFTADLPVDADGLVLDYPGIFRRMS
jgi:uncharacterized protein